MSTPAPTRRQFLGGLGLIAVGFALGGQTGGAAAATGGAVRVTDTPTTAGSWLVITDKDVVVYSGKVELGTGVRTSLAQIVAEELRLTVADVQWVQGDTLLGTAQTGTFGSKTLQNGGPELRRAAATAFAELARRAAGHFGVEVSQVEASGGRFRRTSGSEESITYFKLAGLEQSVIPNAPTPVQVAPSDYRVVGTDVPRVDLPGKLDGTHAYLSDLTVPGMKHGRVVRPPGRNAHLAPDAQITNAPADVIVVRQGDFVGVVADTQWAAVRAAAAISVPWTPSTTAYLPQENLPQELRNSANHYTTTAPGEEERPRPDAATMARLDAMEKTEYFTPFYMHAPMGTSSAVADVRAVPDPATGIQATVWSSSQNVFELRNVLARLLGLPAGAVRVLFGEASGCYGHDGADDVAADAALLSKAAGHPVRVQWSRQDDFGWEPLCQAQAHDMRGIAENGTITAWRHALFAPTANSRPGAASPGSLLAGRLTGLPPAALPLATQRNQAARNFAVNYQFAQHLPAAWVRSFGTTGPSGAPATPVTYTLPRTSSLRSLGGFSNSFANESYLDELAHAAGYDPLELRISLLAPSSAFPEGSRAQEVCGRLRERWQEWRGAARRPGEGAGVAFQRYETTAAFVATMVVVEVRPDRAIRVKRVVVAHDCGLIVNPDGVRNQIEGNVIQGISRTLYEQVSYTSDRITSLAWQESTFRPQDEAYRVIRFNEIPDEIEIILVNRPDQPALGAGEPTIGTIPGAIANAVFDATGVRLRSLPLKLPS